MCGIAGILTMGEVDAGLVGRMADAVAHRGPDDRGVWTDEAAGIGLGHRRLAVVDLSPAGHQPMQSADGRFVLTFNGEIYNHRDLRRQFEGDHGERNWRGTSDTETFVEGIAHWGLEEALRRSAGMYAFALWDRRDRLLHLVRDRFGEKPLYYGWVGGLIAFGSELKALRQVPGFDNPVSRQALGRFAARTYIPAPLSIYERIFKVPPASILTIAPESVRTPRREPPRTGRDGGITLSPYWSYRDVVERGQAAPIRDETEALEQLEESLDRAIAGQSMADVPIGAFLSGGIDSSTIVALYQKHSPVPVRTFSIGFEEAGFNEAEHAKAVARHFGTVHDERYVTVAETRDVIPRLSAMYDEPFADSSQIPTHLVSKFARERVTVAVSGDGGDELFGGYNRYFAAERLWDRMRRIPAPLRAGLGRGLGAVSPEIWNSLIRLGSSGAPGHLGAKVQKGFRVAARSRRIDDLFDNFLDEWAGEPSPVIGADGGGRADLAVHGPAAVRMMFADAVAYLPDDIMVKVDRASMAVALETRAPFLDHRVAEVAARIPTAMKIRGGAGKLILRKLLYQHAPAELFERPKAGFAIPVGDWIKGPLRPWAEDLLDPARMAAEGWFDATRIQRRWRLHLAGRQDSGIALWAILMFQSWLREQKGVLAAAA
ncbi:MAG TPA: asparagine synthase (glutamine-hydrolyzing) [Sphingomicrobium sp.]|nr:asparagine synthase (glutamine-hydrolyzing) [Sphingomicrobium sp.]